MDDRPIEMIGGELGIRARTADSTGNPIYALFTPAPVSGAGLAPAVAERFIAILDRAETLHTAMPLSEQRLELSNEKVKSEQRLQQLEAHPSSSAGGFGLGPDDPRVRQ
jgi:hypothetical protein